MSGPEDAAHWAVHRASGSMSVSDQAKLEAWLAADRRHDGELLQAEVTLAFMDRAQAIAPAMPPASRISRRDALGWSTAAIAAGAAGFWLYPRGDQLFTHVGEVRTARLADSSIVMLNTQSRLSVDLEPETRNISLDRGEAWFQVAHDSARPFIVSADDLRVRAVGTAFSVRRMAGGADVLVTDGTVEVWRAGQPMQRVWVTRDHRVYVPDDSVALAPVSAKSGIERSLAWRSGRLAFAGEILDYAVAELNRYNHTRVRVDDPMLGRVPVYGYFRVDDPNGFAQMIAGSEGARVERDGDTLRLIPRTS